MASKLVPLALFLAALALTACSPVKLPPPALIDAVERGPTELIGTDVLAGDFNSSNLSVLGVRLGMTEGAVLEKLGPADAQNEYDFGAIRNWEYGPKLGTNRTALVLHFRNGFVTRITVYEHLNPYLVGTSVVQGDNSAVYQQFGTPDRQYDLNRGRYFVYNSRGFEVYFSQGSVVAWGFVYPNRKLPSTATLPYEETNLTAPRVPRLILDTTTLCDAGATHAFNTGTGECREYANACLIPAHEIEVADCKPESLTTEKLVEALRA